MGKEPTHHQNSMSSDNDHKVSMRKKGSRKADTKEIQTRLYSQKEMCPKGVHSTGLAEFD